MGSIFMKKGADKISTANIKKFEDIQVIDIDGNARKVGDYLVNKKLVVIVNVASDCGYTNANYKQLMDLYNKYSNRGLQIMGFPCNQFRGQEQKCELDIKKFAKEKFKVEFPLFSKIEVNGENQHELYIYLKSNYKDFKLNDQNLKEIPWNFAKFLVSNEGKVLNYYAPDTEPKEIEKDLDKLI